ncbi:TIGR01459 family HAD-type hydrolase [Rhizobium sp. L1K21]|uniref:TIGR01459 family HAD-type hydrolase n=1 Tax=Rhizobium sp. L1K21 TaxID=2954933 RepID=UPI00209208CA|nr:TIGR01459 family HAD-type hydrolase [Rhizobium sp. L1K21]MCO6186979.1 TIGR01459 family HAD-type hydrolase [Rhizobium sp. L1K21]
MADRIDNLSEVCGNYDLILCDVWGVLHNGIDAFPLAGEALSKARAGGTSVVLITNSPRPQDGVTAQLELIGVPSSAYDRIVTSGDVTRHLIAEGPDKVFLLGPERDMPLFDGLDVEVVGAQEATSVVCTGFFDDETEQPEDYRDMLADFIARDVPLICANPDLIVERGHRLIPCAGAVAALYSQMGGETRIAGKPHSPIYVEAMAVAQEVRGPVDKSRVLAIGDGMPTDVRGALDAGLDLLYISGGIHAGEYTVAGKTDEQALTAYLAREKASPKWWMPRLA